jgi:hypothetical protein
MTHMLGRTIEQRLRTSKKSVLLLGARQVAAAQLGGLRSFATSTKRPVQSYVVFQGDKPQRFADGILAVPFLTFLRDTLAQLAD